ncbi:MAG: MarR family transcriptional regulator, organic hydroperoxide resistance regulator [Fusobacteriaceae bacterium]|jgi:DNA-binding MarR family transcriptional regulator|nr:transcriptional regulator, MarR family [Fusobacteriales bacterium]MDN5305052.1 MarR family transcriptional regulator, organic hydroperoxide resistance regulator [Fusobacteriaceae bacterium]
MSDILKIENQFCFSVYKLMKNINTIYKPLLNELNLTYTQYITMLVLWEKDGLNVNEIGEILSLDSGTLTPLLKKLEKKEYIKRKRNKLDERNLIISLTKKGKELKEKAKNVPVNLLNSFSLDSTEIFSIKQQIDALNKILEK